mmetsp:Transcript_9625/g.18959  ORF Transcript_9625/g.18959 Transcript_9625/m.18959 type:complete len:98 (-) Transcript_9625:379-672(-)|eukprot:CAMPEP_0171496468 /NCGR_PEP_ID=MMETSP0958-20121227/6722_1 /TAXON_ID=87120 /ORGANISM="Aurantiochytrium limacinum, Strain ATCCMYA-1381" /LENGTH=97 /DNA_ID=CAMNT_0012030581 /DNA_START=63 /DNA_END=356 /DNA_ORIENTATION=-
MQRVVASAARVGLRAPAPRALVANNARLFSTEGTDFNKRGRAIEEQYFRHLEEETKKNFSEGLLKKELKTLLEILPADHKLTPEQIHDLLEWKHGSN